MPTIIDTTETAVADLLADVADVLREETALEREEPDWRLAEWLAEVED